MGLSLFIILKKQITFQFDDFRGFIDEMSSSLGVESKKMLEEYIKYAEANSDDELLEVIQEEYAKYSKTYVRYLYNPMLLMAYSYFEHWLKKICEFDHRKGFSKITVSDLYGRNYIEKSKMYLTKVAGINLEDKETQWERITEMQQIRNLIAHYQSNVQKKPDKPIKEQSAFQLLKNEPMISLDENTGDFHITDKSFLYNTIELFQEYLFMVIDRVEQIDVSVKNTTLPHEMSKWGVEKTETLLTHLVYGLDLIKKPDDKTEKHELLNTLSRLEGNLCTMSWNLTKLYALFTNAQWSASEGNLIQQEGAVGFKKLKKRYTNK